MKPLSCSVCHKTLSGVRDKAGNGRAFWQRRFPDALLCKNCWMSPGEIADQLQRDAVAKIIWRARAVSREKARAALISLRGTGVPINPHRRHRKEET